MFPQRVGANGGVGGAPSDILPNHAQLLLAEDDFAWNPVLGAYAILHVIPLGSDQGMYLTTIRPDGTVLVDNVIRYLVVQESTVTRRVAVTANGSMGVLWKESDGFWFALYPPTVDRVDRVAAAPAGTSLLLSSNGT